MSKVQKSLNDFFDSSNYRLTKLFLSMNGTWPYQNRKIQILIKSLFLLGITSAFILEVIYFIEVRKDLNQVFDCVPILIITCITYYMSLNGTHYLYLMKDLLEYIEKSSVNLKDDNEYVIIQKYGREGKKLTILYMGAMFTAFVTFISVPLVSKFISSNASQNTSHTMKNLLYAQYFVDPEKYYVFIYLHGLQAAWHVVFSYLCWDTYLVTTIQHSCSMFEILGYRLKKVDDNDTEKSNQLSKCERDRFMYVEINKCIKYHCECIRYAEKIDKFFKLSWLMQIFLNMILISICGSQTISHSHEPELIIRFGYIALTCCLRLFYICWPGQKLNNYSAEVHNHIYNMPWYKFSIKSSKLLILMLLRSSKPCKMTMWSILILNFESYRMLLQMSVSYFTMILSTKNK